MHQTQKYKQLIMILEEIKITYSREIFIENFKPTSIVHVGDLEQFIKVSTLENAYINWIPPLTLSLLGNSSKSNMRAVSMLLITLRHRWTVPSCKAVIGNISERNFSYRSHSGHNPIITSPQWTNHKFHKLW